MIVPKPDRNGNFVFRSSLLKMIPLVFLVLFSVIIIVLTVISLVSGNYTDIKNVYLRIIMCTVIIGISVYMIVKQPTYVVTHEKLLLYGKWELYFGEIENVILHDNIIGMLEIKGKTESYSIFAFDISCSLKTFSEILTERISVYEQRNT